ncbi:MAG: DUF418 domain-containing protein [Acidobacteriota bacterium]|nr:DUF418 domain-containing protein [Acidobacteriota bacterium]
MEEKKRIIGFDVARSFAVFGMVIVNYKVAMGAGTEPGWLYRLVGLLEGRAAATFVVLAGVGLALMSGGANPNSEKLPRARRTLLRRALFLFIVGLAYTPVWPADILHFYGVYIALAVLFLGAGSRVHWIAVAVLVCGFMILIPFWDYAAEWNFDTLEYSGLWTPTGLFKHIFYNGFHPVFPWAAFLFLGLILGRTELSDGGKRKRIMLATVIIALVTEFLSRFLVGSLEGDIIWLFQSGPMPPNPFYMVAAGSTAVAFIVLCVHLTQKLPDLKLWSPLIATGQLALTLYVAHVLIGMGIMEELGMLGGQPLSTALLASAVFCIGGLLFSWIWRARFKRGPLEWAMRKLT